MLSVEHERGYTRHQKSAMMTRVREQRALVTDDSSSSTTGTSGAARPSGASDRAPRTIARHTLTRSDGTHATIELVLGDLTEQQVDAIVNPSNRGLFGTAGVDGATHAKAGPELTDACRAIGGIDYGQAVHTPGFRLPARYVIHTAAMPWKGGRVGEQKTLHAAYTASLDVARSLRAGTVALPAMGAGAHGYPPEIAAEVAVDAVLVWLAQPGPTNAVRFVILDEALAAHYQLFLEQALANVWR
jgi:O-acetyl-ADP-ribose deacetylase